MPRRNVLQRSGVGAPKLKLSKLKEAELKRTVKNFNRRVKEAAKRGIDRSILPKKITVSDVKKKASSVLDVNRLINQMNKATAKTLQASTSGKTKWQDDIDKVERARNLPLKRAQKRKELLKESTYSTTGRRFPTQHDWIVKSIGITDEDTADDMLKKVEGWLQGKNLARSEQWRQNYLKTINDNIQAALSNGDTLSPVALGNLRDAIESMDLVDFLIGQLTNSAQLAIGFLLVSGPSQGATTQQMEDQMNAYNSLIEAWDKYL